LLQIVLFGQPELDATLAKQSLRQLRDRITHGFRMRPLAEPEVAKYISFRMRAAGYRGPEVFSPRAVSLIARAASGLTRRINILADKSLLSAFTENFHAVTDRQVRAAIADSEFAAVRTPPRRPAAFVAAALAGGLLAGAAIQWFLSSRPIPSASAPVPVAAPAPAAVRPAQPDPAPAEASPQTPPQTETAKAPEPPPRQLSAEQQRRLAGYSAAGQQLLRSRISATRELLDRAPASATPSSCSSPTIPTRRAWSAFYCAPASSFPSKASS
jgi:hypothetical protein